MRSTKTIFVDIDGCFADFVGAVLKIHNADPKILETFKGDYEITKHLNMTPYDFWDRIEQDPGFWHNLEKTPEADPLMAFLEEKAEPKNIFFCSSPSHDPRSHYGKAHWIKKHYPNYISRLILTNHKHLLGQYNRVLIDDSNANCTKFKDRGGHPVLLPRPWNKKHTIRPEDALEHVITELRRTI